MTDPHPWRRWSAAAILVAALLSLSAASRSPGAAQEPAALGQAAERMSGEQLYERDCVFCHGIEGGGTSRGPALDDVGTAGVHFMLSTGRMPIDDPDQELRRRPPAYTEDEIGAIVEYTSSFLEGPEAAAEVEPDESLVAHGGELYRINCVACHQMAGTGGVLVDAQAAPTLHFSTTQQLVEAIRTGPGTMPSYSESTLSDEDARAIASYVVLVLRDTEDPGGLPLGHFGPWSEGFITWAGGILALLVVARWIGRRT